MTSSVSTEDVSLTSLWMWTLARKAGRVTLSHSPSVPAFGRWLGGIWTEGRETKQQHYSVLKLPELKER